jgi:hypothetical protein
LIEKYSYVKYSQTEIKGDKIENVFPILNDEVLVCTQSGRIHYLEKTDDKYTQKIKCHVSLGLENIRAIQLTERTIDMKGPFDFVIRNDDGIYFGTLELKDGSMTFTRDQQGVP